MNVEIPGNRLGMGVNLFSDEQTLIEKFGVDECTRQIMQPSAFMDSITTATISEEVMEGIKEKATIMIRENKEGSIVVSLNRVKSQINYLSVKYVEMELIDKETGETQTMQAELVRPNINDINYYYHKVTFTKDDERLGGKTLDDFDIVFYLSAGDFDHYRVADLEHNLVQK